jgi:hypothetical protein
MQIKAQAVTSQSSRSIDWYGEGEARMVETNGVTMMVRFLGRKGRRGRILIVAPPGSTFRTAAMEGDRLLRSRGKSDDVHDQTSG